MSASLLNTHVRDNLLETAPGKAAAAGDLFQATAATAIAALTLGTQGYQLRAGASAAQWDGFVLARKTADETVTASTTLQNDDHLLAAIGANEDWAFELLCIVDGPSGADIKTAFTVPAGATLAWSGIGLTTAAADGTGLGIATMIEVSGTAGSWGLLGSATEVPLRLWGTVENGANAGNLQLQWAQDVSDGTGCTMFTNSWLKAYQIT